MQGRERMDAASRAQDLRDGALKAAENPRRPTQWKIDTAQRGADVARFRAVDGVFSGTRNEQNAARGAAGDRAAQEAGRVDEMRPARCCSATRRRCYRSPNSGSGHAISSVRW